MRVLGVNKNFYSGINQKELANNITFGRLVNGKDYPDDLVEEAERILNSSQKVDINNYKQSFVDCLADSKIQPLEWLLAPFAKLIGSDDPMAESRIAVGCCTLGLSEILKMPEAGIRKLISNRNAEKHVAKIKDCMLDLLKEQKARGIKL